MTPPVFAHGHLRLYLLSLLATAPMHGYELIQGISDRFGGTYIPSAGTIYPRLAKLEEEGLVTKAADGRKTVYEITDAGRAELAARESELDEIENDVTDSVRRLANEVRASVTEAMKSLRADLAAAAREVRDEARQASRAARSEPGSGGATDGAGRPGTSGADAEGGAEPASSTASAAASAPTDAGATGGLVHEVELVLAEFRLNVRTDVRALAARGALTRETVDALTRRLAEVRDAL